MCVKWERSKFVGDLEMFQDYIGEGIVREGEGSGEGLGYYSDDDVDGDDYGFLSYLFFFIFFFFIVNKMKFFIFLYCILLWIWKSKIKFFFGVQYVCMWSLQVSEKENDLFMFKFIYVCDLQYLCSD